MSDSDPPSIAGPVREILEQQGGASNWRLLQQRYRRAVVGVTHTDGTRSVIKLDTSAARIGRELAVVNHLRESPADYLVPRVISSGSCATQSMHYMRLEWLSHQVEHDRVTRSQRQAVGCILRVLHTALSADPQLVESPVPWDAHIASFANHHTRRLVDAGLVRRQTADDLLTLVSSVPVGEGLVVHGDMKSDHLFLTRTGVGLTVRFIDFADVRVADPLWDIAVLCLDRPTWRNDLLRGYVSNDTARDAVKRRIAIYQAVRALADANWSMDYGVQPTFYRSRLARVLKQLGAYQRLGERKSP
jgi:aminoglycoside phosphotransferase (APT) family kinase protein